MSTSCTVAPSLRNVSKTNPYYHDRRYNDLEELLGRHYKDMKSQYISDCKTGKKIADVVRVLSPYEIKNLIVFLKTLESDLVSPSWEKK